MPPDILSLMKGTARIRVRVMPGARCTEVAGRHGESWRLRVQPAPERGRATEAALLLLAESLSVPRNDVSLVSGHTSRDKLVAVSGLTSREAERRLAKAAG
jgi:uncharacterized protein YggU (UPF0235/DUF167 family)